MPVVNIPMSELAHNAFYSLHRPLFGLSIPEPFLLGDIVGQIEKEEEKTDNDSKEALAQYMRSLRPFEPPELKPVNMTDEENNAENSNQSLEGNKCSTTTTLTIEVDPAYFLKHNSNHDEIADYLTAMQEKLDLLYEERDKMTAKVAAIAAGCVPMNNSKIAPSKKKLRRLRKRNKGFFERN
ncbi:hypothetical protein BDF20DRAFT_839399 [Mycotypha africana]|uniref:uncharacterized protein n=1 Tax=Mycotypha africana TaxID=64632 RepID=UPI00230168DB|nr:uncharacterized protein BDF20DRAFT_839399 [Mycotypha africana]KAI8968276.1 hypothetical protein BDF20DRAFT_839399 [Mycotypha africana]